MSVVCSVIVDTKNDQSLLNSEDETGDLVIAEPTNEIQVEKVESESKSSAIVDETEKSPESVKEESKPEGSEKETEASSNFGTTPSAPAQEDKMPRQFYDKEVTTSY